MSDDGDELDDGRRELERLNALADELVADGLAVFPFWTWPAGDGTLHKRPAHPHGHHGATVDRQEFRRMVAAPWRPSDVPGEATLVVGFVPGSGGYVVLDCDVKGGKAGRQSLERLLVDHPHLAGAAWRTPSGGVNVLCRKHSARAIGSSSPWPGIDVCGDGRGVVAPGQTVTFDGREYGWQWRRGSSSTASILPAALDALLNEARVGERPALEVEVEAFVDARSGPDRWTARGKTVVDELLADLAVSAVGSRHDATLSAVGTVCATSGVNVGEALDRVEDTYRRLVAGERRPVTEWPDLRRWVIGQQLADEERRREWEATVTAMIPPTSAPRDSTRPGDPSYAPVELGPYLAGHVDKLRPDTARMTDGRALLYGGRLNSIHGDSGAGKSWVVVLVVAELILAGKGVVVVDTEDDPTPMIERLRQIGVGDEAILERLAFVHPSEEFSAANVEAIMWAVREYGAAHVVIDSLGEAFALDGVDENADAQVTPWLRRVVRRLIDTTGVAVTLIDHLTKAAELPLHPSGSKRKRAAITGAAWLMEAVEPFTYGEAGRARLICAKDRHGNYRRGDTVAELVMGALDLVTGLTRLELHPVGAGEASEERAPTALVIVCNVLESVKPRWFSMTKILATIGEADAEMGWKKLVGACELGVERGFLVEELGPRRARNFQRTDEPLPWRKSRDDGTPPTPPDSTSGVGGDAND